MDTYEESIGYDAMGRQLGHEQIFSSPPDLCRKRVWEVLEIAQPGDKASRIFDLVISGAIILAVLAVVLESEPLLQIKYATGFIWLEWLCLAIFIPEYLLGLWACKEDEKYAGTWGRMKWMLSPMTLIDLAAILPSLLWFLGLDLRVLRAVRLMRLLRLAGHNKGIVMIKRTFIECKSQLFICLSGVSIILLISSSLLYLAENQANPEAFGSIPSAMWWGVCTLSTVGYGDVYPITGLGKFLASIIAVLGIGVFALPAGIIAANIEKVWKSDDRENQKCPHCGKGI